MIRVRQFVVAGLFTPLIAGCSWLIPEREVVLIPDSDPTLPMVRMIIVTSEGDMKANGRLDISASVSEHARAFVAASAYDPDGVRRLELRTDSISWHCRGTTPFSVYPTDTEEETVGPEWIPAPVLEEGTEIAGDMGPTRRLVGTEAKVADVFSDVRTGVRGCGHMQDATIIVTQKFSATAENYDELTDDGPVASVSFSGPYIID